MSAPATSATEQGRDLIANRRRLDSGEAEWLLALADFDTWGAWAEDGHSSCVAWLIEKCGVSRPTAKEKLRVAKELDRRPALAEAFVAGDLSYANARAVSRYDGKNAGVEAELIASASRLTNAELEKAVRYARGLADQERSPKDRFDSRGVSRSDSIGGGLTRVYVDCLPEDAERLFNILDAYLDHVRKQAKTDSGNPLASADSGNPRVEESDEPSPEDPAARRSIVQRRYDALIDLLEHAAAHHHEQGHIDIERTTIGVTVDYDTLLDRAPGRIDLESGVPLTGEAARRLACDAAVHRIIVKGQSQVLDIGEKSRNWPTPMRRAIASRHNHMCAIKGCGRRIHQIHHVIHWGHDGPTEVNNGVPLCYTHHHYVHEGRWTITWNPTTGITTLIGPAGQRIESHTKVPTARAA